MRQLIFICFILINFPTSAQKTDSTYYLDFIIKAKHLSEGSFEVQNKKLYQEFVLTGKKSNKYSIEILNDSNSVLSEYVNGLWKSMDTVHHTFYIIDTNTLLVPSFYVVDFNNDGNQDLLCWTVTNINGNRWTEIYLNDSNTLIKLENTADGIWANPEYNKNEGIITCEEVSGNFGVFYTSKYKLKGLKAFPIEKHETDNTEMVLKNGKYVGQIIRDYIGENGGWKIINIKKEK